MKDEKGIIHDVDTRYDTDYLKKHIDSSVKITDIKRMHRKVDKDGKTEYVPRRNIIVIFEGNVLPTHVVVNFVYLPVERFVGRVIQCYKCLKFGHISKQCKGTQEFCIRCAEIKNDSHICDTKKTFCIHCKSKDHISISKSCPVYEEQKKIKNIMLDQKISFLEAKRFKESSFSEFVSNNKFSILSNLEENFPKLPNVSDDDMSSHPTIPRSYMKKSTNFTHPGPSRINTEHNALKKRKVSTPVSQSPTDSSTFPFRFGPLQPLPPNPNKPNSSIDGEKNKMVISLVKFFSEFIKNVKSFEDAETLDNNLLAKGLHTVLEDIFKDT
ncbi:uncharacterized protein [Diabrotica undecimpunctata]|uniref:uncharacterized protein n=1 Tax=Diabrotica undecimpunctata TaxID=50387 RepID=UPI003B63B3FB